MQHKVKVTVIRKCLFQDLQKMYCADPESGACPCYNEGDEFVFERYDDADDFWHMGLNTLRKTIANPEHVAGGPKLPFCSEAWDAISRYIYTGLQGGSIMHGWMNDERVMVCACSDATRPVLYEVRRMDYKVVKIEGMTCDNCANKVESVLKVIDGVESVNVRLDKKWAEVFVTLNTDPDDTLLSNAVNDAGYLVIGID